jgi:signal transduction histidine kinase
VVKIATMIDDSITQARNLARGLFPVRLESEGLEMALQELATNIHRRYDICCYVECHEGLPACGRTTGIHLYRIAQEAMVNAAKHSGSNRVTVTLRPVPDGVRMIIEDQGQDGQQMMNANSAGMGMRIMEYRARLIGAVLHAGCVPNGGFRVTCVVNAATFRQ